MKELWLSQGRENLMRNVPKLIIPFKRKVYERVVKEFAKFTKD